MSTLLVSLLGQSQLQVIEPQVTYDLCCQKLHTIFAHNIGEKSMFGLKWNLKERLEVRVEQSKVSYISGFVTE